uniref:Predicted dehydrogenases and related proteins n=1 Tax=uncultured verrucomicrobium HF0500_16O23 TaxID=723598 RepID=E7C575_9BACT|nr:predicted dehydrogenases and related proteins [uncultured verrucomicrobium HF0500_16O23]
MRMKRRQFLATTAAALTFPYVGRVLGANEKLNIGVVGVAGRGGGNLKGVSGENIVALCDVDAARLTAAAKQFPAAKQYGDFRRMLKQKDIDAVVCSTPDHTHAVIGVAALKSGRHLYCEKPLAHTVSEVRAMTVAAAKHKRVTQMGTQIHAGSNYRRVVELVRSGAIGDVKEVHVWSGAAYGNIGLSAPDAPIAKGFDYDLWLGPLPYRPFRKEYAPFHWRHFWEFGGGTLADFWCHYSDLAHWALDLKHPLTIHAQGKKARPERVTVAMKVQYEYPARGAKPQVNLTWYQGGEKPAALTAQQKKKWGSGVLFVGEKGNLLSGYGNHVLLPEDKFKDFKRPPRSIPDSIGHHAEWIKACKEDGKATCDFSYSGPLAECALLGIVSHRVGNKKLEWDWKSMKATNCPEAERYVHHQYRNGWSL